MKIIGPYILISSFYQVKCFFLIQNFRTVTQSQIRVKWSEERETEKMQMAFVNIFAQTPTMKEIS